MCVCVCVCVCVYICVYIYIYIRHNTSFLCQKVFDSKFKDFCLVWFLCLMAYQPL